MSMGATSGEDGRKAARRRSYDALMASAKGSGLEATIARYAAEMGLVPEDPAWDEAAPVLFALEATRIQTLAAVTGAVEDAIGPALRDSLIAIGDEPLTAAFVKEATGPAFVGGINEIVQTANGSIKTMTDESRKSVKALKGAVEWWHPITAASLALIVMGLGGFAEARYIRESVTASVSSQAYSAGYRAAERQRHPNPGHKK